jgi:hypothetical protein
LNPETADILRETQISRFYRYAKKTQISLNPKKCRYVGDIARLRKKRKKILHRNKHQNILHDLVRRMIE